MRLWGVAAALAGCAGDGGTPEPTSSVPSACAVALGTVSPADGALGTPLEVAVSASTDDGSGTVAITLRDGSGATVAEAGALASPASLPSVELLPDASYAVELGLVDDAGVACDPIRTTFRTGFAAGDDDDDTGLGDDDDDTTVVSVCGDPLPFVQVGTGDVAYQALAEGDPIVVVHGPQGGWHIDIGGRVGTASTVVEVSATVMVVSTGLTIAGGDQPASRLALVDWTAATCLGDFWGARAFLDDVPVDQAFACALDGEALDVAVTVTVAGEGSVTEILRVTAARDAVDAKLCPTG